MLYTRNTVYTSIVHRIGGLETSGPSMRKRIHVDGNGLSSERPSFFNRSEHLVVIFQVEEDSVLLVTDH